MLTEAVLYEVPGFNVAKSTQQVVVVDESPTQISLYERSVEPLSAELRAFHNAADALEHLAASDVDLLAMNICKPSGAVRYVTPAKRIA